MVGGGGGGGVRGGGGLGGGSCSVPVAVVEGEDFREDLFFFFLELAAREEGEVFVGMTTQKLSSSEACTSRLSTEASELESSLSAARAEMGERLAEADAAMRTELSAKQSELDAKDEEAADVRAELDSFARTTSTELTVRATELHEAEQQILESQKAASLNAELLRKESIEHVSAMAAVQADMYDKLSDLEQQTNKHLWSKQAELEAVHCELETMAQTSASELQSRTDALMQTESKLRAADATTAIVSQEVEELESELAAAKHEMRSKQVALEQQMADELSAKEAEVSASKTEVASVRAELD